MTYSIGGVARLAVDPFQGVPGEAHLVGVARQPAVPISVLRRAERGSKLNEPTKMRLRSTAKVFACRLASELPPRSPLFASFKVGLSS